MSARFDAGEARAAVLGALLIGAPSVAHAEDPGTSFVAPSPVAYRPVELGVGGQLTLASGMECTRIESDVVGCANTTGAPGLHLAPQYRMSPGWSLGVRGDVMWASSSSAVSTTWWAARLEGRWHPLGSGATDPWLALDAGAVAIAQRLDAGELGPATTRTDVAPIFGGGVGIDFRVAPFLALGPALRSFVIPRGRTIEPLPDRGTSYATEVGVSVEAQATLLLGER